MRTRVYVGYLVRYWFIIWATVRHTQGLWPCSKKHISSRGRVSVEGKMFFAWHDGSEFRVRCRCPPFACPSNFQPRSAPLLWVGVGRDGRGVGGVGSGDRSIEVEGRRREGGSISRQSLSAPSRRPSRPLRPSRKESYG